MDYLTKNPCDNLSCQNGAKCRRIDENRAVCDCDQLKYYGDHCEFSYENTTCAQLNCQNGSNCVNKNGMSMCKCSKKFHGFQCENKILDRCQSSPCENGATCVNGIDEYRCKCPKGFSGYNCNRVGDDSE